MIEKDRYSFSTLQAEADIRCSKYLEKTLTVPRPDVLEPRQVTVKNDNAYVVVENVTYAFRHLCADGKCNSLFQ